MIAAKPTRRKKKVASGRLANRRNRVKSPGLTNRTSTEGTRTSIPSSVVTVWAVSSTTGPAPVSSAFPSRPTMNWPIVGVMTVISG